MCEFNRASGTDDRMDEALLFAEKVFDSLAALYPPAKTSSGERVVSYSLLLAVVTVLCDSLVEDKLFTSFMVLSDSIDSHKYNDEGEIVGYAPLAHVTDYIRGVFAGSPGSFPCCQRNDCKGRA